MNSEMAYCIIIEHFTVLCSVTRPLNENKTGIYLLLIQTSVLFLCKCITTT